MVIPTVVEKDRLSRACPRHQMRARSLRSLSSTHTRPLTLNSPYTHSHPTPPHPPLSPSAVFTLLCVVAPKLVHVLGPRMCMVIGGLPYIGMILANLKPGWGLSVSMNALVGLGAPLLWTGSGVYLGRAASHMAQQRQIELETATSDLNGMFFSFFQSNGVIGTVAGSVILISVDDAHAASTILYATLGGVCVLGVVVLMFLRDIEAPKQQKVEGYQIVEAEADEGSDDVSLIATLRQMCVERRVQLMIIIIFYNGLSLGFIFGDYPKRISQPLLGVKTGMVGFVVAAFYLTNSIFTFILGKLAGTKFGRRGVCLVATLAHVAFYLWLLLWRPGSHADQGHAKGGHGADADQLVGDMSNYNYTYSCNGTSVPSIASSCTNFTGGSVCDGVPCATVKTEHMVRHPEAGDYVMAFMGVMLFALGDSVWESQPPAILQTFFAGDNTGLASSQANLKMWQSFGFASQFLLDKVLEDYFDVQVIILLTLQVLGAILLFSMDKWVAPIDVYTWCSNKVPSRLPERSGNSKFSSMGRQ